MLIPNNKQKTKLFQYANTARYAYNWALGREKENYKNDGKFLSDGELRKEFTQLKKTDEYSWLNEISNNVTKQAIKDAYDIEHSKCYTEYGLKRTGCAGCPFGRDFEYELEVIQKYEPKLYKAVNNIFGDSYEYTRKYREFVKKMNKK